MKNHFWRGTGVILLDSLFVATYAALSADESAWYIVPLIAHGLLLGHLVTRAYERR